MIPGGRGEKQVLAGVISVIRTITLVLTSEREKEIVKGKAFRNYGDFRTRDKMASRAHLCDESRMHMRGRWNRANYEAARTGAPIINSILFRASLITRAAH